MTQVQKIAISIVAFLLLIGGAYYLLERDEAASPNNEQNAPTPPPAEDSATPPPSDDKPSYQIDIQPLGGPPTLNRIIEVRAALTAAQKTQAEAKIRELVGILKKTPNDHPVLIDLGSYWRVIGDYDAARQVWEYVTQVSPDDSVAYSNLGILYAENLKDNTKAEEYFLKAISKDPTYGNSYVQLAEFYYYVLKDNAKARAILEKGIAANSGNTDLLQQFIDAYSE